MYYITTWHAESHHEGSYDYQDYLKGFRCWETLCNDYDPNSPLDMMYDISAYSSASRRRGGWCLHSLWWSLWWTATQLFLLSLIYLSANYEEAAAALHRLAPFLLGWNVVSSLLVSPNTSWRCTAEQHQKDVVPNTVTVIRQPAYYCARQNADSLSQNDNDEEEVVKTVQHD